MSEPDLTISVVVASLGRARMLVRCLTALHQLRYPAFEVIVVADADGTAVARALPFGARLILLPQDSPNLAAARNDGIAVAAGAIVAFIDDDAVPEPTWLDAIAAAMADRGLAAVTGPVLGRNGISLQWGRTMIDALGRDRTDDPGGAFALKLHGTNMAVRRDVLMRVGGFDRAFEYYLDDTDMACRLHKHGARVAYLDNAVVHHGLAASARRSADRLPLSLFDIGASTHAFLRRHARPDARSEALVALEEEQRNRLLRLARKRKLSARRLRLLMESLADGIADGADRRIAQTWIEERPRPFHPLRTGPPPPMQELSGWWMRARHLRRKAAACVADGQPVTLFLFEPSPRKHSVRFTSDHGWEHYGGLYGCTERNDTRVQVWNFQARKQAERHRIAHLRGFAL